MSECGIRFVVHRNSRGKYEVRRLSINGGIPSTMTLKSFAQESKANEYRVKMEGG